MLFEGSIHDVAFHKDEVAEVAWRSLDEVLADIDANQGSWANSISENQRALLLRLI